MQVELVTKSNMYIFKVGKVFTVCSTQSASSQIPSRCVQPLRRIVESNAILKKKCGTKFDRPEK
jgi:hypothetical protein